MSNSSSAGPDLVTLLGHFSFLSGSWYYLNYLDYSANLLNRWRVHISLHVAIVAHVLFELVLTFAWRLSNSCPPLLLAVLFGLNINSI